MGDKLVGCRMINPTGFSSSGDRPTLFRDTGADTQISIIMNAHETVIHRYPCKWTFQTPENSDLKEDRKNLQARPALLRQQSLDHSQFDCCSLGLPTPPPVGQNLTADPLRLFHQRAGERKTCFDRFDDAIVRKRGESQTEATVRHPPQGHRRRLRSSYRAPNKGKRPVFARPSLLPENSG